MKSRSIYVLTLLLLILLPGCGEDQAPAPAAGATLDFYFVDALGLAADGDTIYSSVYAGDFWSDSRCLTPQWKTYQTTDGGTTWAVRESALVTSSENSNFTHAGKGSAILVPTAGTILAAGVFNDIWNTRQSTDSGVTWTLIDAYTHPSASTTLQPPEVTALAQDGSNNIYMVGRNIDTDALSHWIVRKSTDTGDTWTTVDDYILDVNNPGPYWVAYNQPNAIVTNSADDIFVVGVRKLQLSDTKTWLVRKSTDGGTSWNNVDLFTGAGSDEDCEAHAIDRNAADHLFVVGECNSFESIAYNRWIVRKSIDGGTSWSTVDDYVLKTNVYATAMAVKVDAANNIYVSGDADTSAQVVVGPIVTTQITGYWMTRKSTDGGTNWTIVDQLENNANHPSNRSLVIDTSGNVYASGVARSTINTSSTSQDWIMRKSVDAGATWTTIVEETYPTIFAAE